MLTNTSRLRKSGVCELSRARTLRTLRQTLCVNFSTPDPDKLVKGPGAFGYTRDSRDHPDNFKELFHFIGRYVGGVIGKSKINKALKEHKGKTLLHMVSVDTMVHVIHILNNHQVG